MDKLKQKSSIVFELLFSQETRQTYGKALTLTWNILKETALLLWLLFCSVFLVFFWGGNYIKQASQNVKTWYTDLDEEHVIKEGDKVLFCAVGAGLTSAGCIVTW